jgi:RNA polymerase sigma factor (sigma-70 family)
VAATRIQEEGGEYRERIAALVAQHEHTLLRVARQNSLCHDDALDAYQRALEIYVRRVASVEPATEVAWLKVVVRHEAMAIRRTRAQLVAADDIDLDAVPHDAARGVEERFAATERARRSAEALRALKPDEAKALLMKAHGLSYDEIGERYGWTYTNVMSTVAVFIALGGSSYAAFTISGSDIKNRSIAGKKLKRNTLTGKQIRESRLSRVPRARNADRLNGATASSLRIRCPGDTFPTADVCVERSARATASYGSAVLECAMAGTPAGPGRRLPTHGELRAALTAVPLAAGGELTSEVYPSSSIAGQVDVLYIMNQGGGVSVTPNTGAGGKAFRCVTDPLN